MAKRFTDTGKWAKESFYRLSPKMKLVWVYLCDNCDYAGFWDINLPLLSFQTGDPVTLEEVLSGLGDKVEIWGSKIFVPSFIEFQYGELKISNKVHKSVLQKLEKVVSLKPQARGGPGAKEKEKEKEMDMEKEKEKEKGGSGGIFQSEIPEGAMRTLQGLGMLRSLPGGRP